MTKTLITDALVLTMDDELGTLPRGDVLIDGSRIAAVGPDLDARVRRRGRRRPRPDRHARLRGHPPAHVGRDAARLRLLRRPRAPTSTTSSSPTARTSRPRTPTRRSASASPRRSTPASRRCTPGSTTSRRPRHADAALQALDESGLRGRFSYGPSSDPEAGSSFAQGTETDRPRRRAAPAQRALRAGRGQRLHLGIACRGVDYSQPEIWQREFAWAREHGLPITTHTMMTAHDVERVRAISVYEEHQALGPDVPARPRHPHQRGRARATWRETGTPVSLSILSELRVGHGHPADRRDDERGRPAVPVGRHDGGQRQLGLLRRPAGDDDDPPRRPPGRQGLPARPGAAARHDRRRPRPRARRRHRLADARASAPTSSSCAPTTSTSRRSTSPTARSCSPPSRATSSTCGSTASRASATASSSASSPAQLVAARQGRGRRAERAARPAADLRVGARGGARAALPRQRREQLVDGAAGQAAQLVVGAVLDRVGDQHAPQRRRAEQRGLVASRPARTPLEATSTAGPALPLEADHVAQTARHAGASIGERLDDRVAALGDVAAQVGRRGLGERRLGRRARPRGRGARAPPRGRPGTRRRAACGCPAARCAPASPARAAPAGARGPRLARRVEDRLAPWRHLLGHGRRADLAARPAAEDHPEQPGVAACVGDQDALRRGELRHGHRRGR